MSATAWIAPAGAAEERNVCFQAVSVFELAAVPAGSELRITAESRYRLYVNGVYLGDGPARGSRTGCFVDSYPVAPLLRRGRNAVAVEVQCMNYPSFIAVPAEPALWVEFAGGLELEPAWRVRRAPEWRGDTDYFSLQSGYAEWIDHRLESSSWLTGEGVGDWEPAVVIAAERPLARKKLIPRPIPALREREYEAPRPVAHFRLPPADCADVHVARLMTEEELTALPAAAATAPWHWEVPADGGGFALIVDFGREVIGEVTVEIEGAAGTVVDLGFEEALWQGRIRADSPGDPSYNFADRHILAGGRTTVGNRFSERGFRMMEIALREITAPVTIHRIAVRDRRYPWPEAAEFACSDPEITAIRCCCIETLACCSTDVFMDCPWRERAFWTNDALVENRATLAAFGPAALHRHCFDLLLNQCWESNGLFPGPCPGPPEGYNDGAVLIPSNLYIWQMLEDYVDFSGDLEVMRRHWAGLLRILETFAGWSGADGLVTPPAQYWNFFDWSFERNGYSFQAQRCALLNYWYIGAMRSALRLARLAGLAGTAALPERIGRAARTLTEEFHDPASGRIVDCCLRDGQPERLSSQLVHAAALASGTVPEERIPGYVRALEDDALLAPDLFLLDVVLRQMGRQGRGESALQRIRDCWGPIVRSGAPTIWESRDGKAAFQEAGSLCHGFTAMPVTFVQEAILGIRALEPGFRRFRIAPEPCGLDWARGSVLTMAGTIDIAWKTEEYGRLAIEAVIPESCCGVTADGREFASGRHRWRQ